MDANGCFAADCGGLKGQDISAANKCDIKKTVQEDYDSCEFCTFCFCYVFLHVGLMSIGLTQLPGVQMQAIPFAA